MDAGEKSAAYLIKKEELKEKRRELEGEGMGMGADHRSNIDRLKSLIKNSRAFVKAPDSGV